MSDSNLPDHVDWRRVARLTLASRAMDALEERELVPAKKVAYQFSARGHDVAQVVLGTHLKHRHDAGAGYYRSRPFLLSLGLPFDDALAGPLGKSGGYSDGRDIGVVCNFPNANGPSMLPMAGGVGTQYTPVAGWAQAVRYRARTLQEPAFEGAIGVVLGGDGSVATNGFWSALTMATTQQLPMLFYVEDNGFGISVPSSFQTPGGNIAQNLASFEGLTVLSGDGAAPAQAARLIGDAVARVREWRGPVLLRLTVPRLSGHSAQDTQAYKSADQVEAEQARDPLPRLKAAMVPAMVSESDWAAMEQAALTDVRAALDAAEARPDPDKSTVHTFVFTERDDAGQPVLQRMGGLWPDGHDYGPSSEVPQPQGARINMVTAIRKTLDAELRANPKMLLFGEDIGPKGGVHGVTLGLQQTHGLERVFDTSLSEEGIVGRAIGMAYAGLLPAAEIQFRKYADPATEHINDCGTIRWRTNNRFAAPMMLRMPVGYSPRCGDPWHSQCDESAFIHAVGWQVVFPSNAEDAVGLLRSALRSNDPTVFFEHRALLDGKTARRPYPGDEFVVPIGVAQTVREGRDLTVVTWGAMVERVEEATAAGGVDAEILDLRSLMPWDKEAVLRSVEKTGRCLIVHEDALTAGFGAEVAAHVASEAFLFLKAPVDRIAVHDVPLPYAPTLLFEVLPSVETIKTKMDQLMEF